MLSHFLRATDRDPEISSAPRLKSPIEQIAESRYQYLANSDSTGVYFCDASGVITYYNNQAVDLWGRKPALGDTDERFCGAYMLYRVDGSAMPHDECPMADVLAGKVSGIYDAEVQIDRPDGSRVAVIVNIAPLIDGKGLIVGAVNSFCEIPYERTSNEPCSKPPVVSVANGSGPFLSRSHLLTPNCDKHEKSVIGLRPPMSFAGRGRNVGVAKWRA
jgi:PAS domain-containing protein